MKKIPEIPPQLQEISSPHPASSNKKLLPGQRTVFGEILSEQFNCLAGTSDSTPPSQGLPELEGVYSAVTLNLPAGETAITEKINSSIDLFDAYASMLSNPDNTLKQAQQLLEDISEKNRNLREDLDQSQPTDPRLEKILTHLTTLVEVEQIKINRGDYMDLPRDT